LLSALSGQRRVRRRFGFQERFHNLENERCRNLTRPA
jgi:hypothetical protein